MRPIYRIAFALFLAAPLATPARAVEPDAPQALITRTEAIRLAVQNRLSAKFTTTTDAKKGEQGALVEYYAVADQRLLWVDENGLTERGKAVMAEIEKADDYGLRASDYALPDPAGFSPADANATDWLADAETKISYAALRYARDARGGRIEPQRLTPNLDPTLALPNPTEVIEFDRHPLRSRCLSPELSARSAAIRGPQAEADRATRRQDRGACAGRDHSRRPDAQMGRRARASRAAQAATEMFRSSRDPPATRCCSTRPLLEAVKQFQRTHGIFADGMVGPGTRRVLNAPNQRPSAGSPAQIRQILVNMERWRWLPHDLGAFYVMTNVPEFMLRVVKDDEPIFTTRVVVGKTNTQTPVFSNEMQTVVFGPYWNMPNSIKVGEIRPYLRQEASWFFGGGGWNTSVLQRHGVRMRYGSRDVDPSTIDWNRVDIRNFELYQPPGPGNVLGKVKFMFPNKHDVYMHDTPQKHLFANTIRAESHGCMRVQNPDQLASIIMQHDQGWSQARTRSAMDTAYDQQIPLRQKIPVYISYFTLKVNADGSVSTYGDLYGHDTRMATGLKL